MTNKVIIPQPIRPINTQYTQETARTNKAGVAGFDRVLNEKLSQIKFSGHAQQRLKSRNISFGEQEMNDLQNAVSKAREKGARESLILMKDVALVVSIKNNTVITAVDGDSLKENVFTNIDSAIVI
jgi:flagellar operon protein